MSPVHIVTDGAVQYPNLGLPQSYPVSVVPMTMVGADQSMTVSYDTDLSQLRSLFQDPHKAPIFSAPTVEDMANTYSGLLRRTDSILSIHSSAAVSDAVKNAKAASKLFLGRCDIHVIDSQMISMGLGLLVQAAAKAAMRRENLDDIIHIVRSMIHRLYVIFCLEDLMYLERHSLVSLSQAILGNMLGIIPFLTLEQGRLIPMEKVRSRQRALDKLIEFVTEFTSLDYLALLHDREQPSNEAKTITDRLKEMYPDTPISIGTYNPHLATFIGLNSLGLVVLESKEAQK
jgi:DegV family protein with EDD domain